MAGEDEFLEKNYIVPTTENANQVVPPIDQDHEPQLHDTSHDSSDSDSDSHPETYLIESTTASKEARLQHRCRHINPGTEAVDLERSGTFAAPPPRWNIQSSRQA